MIRCTLVCCTNSKAYLHHTESLKNDNMVRDIYTVISNAVHSVIIQEKLEVTKGVIRIRISKKDRQHNGQKKKYKQRSTKHYV